MTTSADPANRAAPENPVELAATWRARLDLNAAASDNAPNNAPNNVPRNAPLPRGNKALTSAALAEFAAQTIKAGQTLLLVVPDDEWLPDISNALPLDLRPLCLVLPEADFAAAIALRATLSLLKSRLSRGVDAEFTQAWEGQRACLEQQADLWQTALEWCAAGRDGGVWPARIGALFPVLILPAAQAVALSLAARDSLLLVQADQLIKDAPQLLAHGTHVLLLRDPSVSTSRELTRVDEERRLKAELEVLAQELGEMELEFATAQAELAEFTRRYYDTVGKRLAELDALQAQIAKLLAKRAPADATVQQQAERAEAQAEQSQRERERFRELDRQNEKPFRPSGDLKRLFRHLAQKIHPDRAENEDDRTWRTELMSEANRAYRAGDEMVLRDILDQWQEGRPDANIDADARAGTAENRTNAGGAGTAPAAALSRQIARLQRRLAEINEQLNRLLASRLYELFAAANLARNRNRDLLQELAEQLEGQIAAARLQLEQLGGVEEN